MFNELVFQIIDQEFNSHRIPHYPIFEIKLLALRVELTSCFPLVYISFFFLPFPSYSL